MTVATDPDPLDAALELAKGIDVDEELTTQQKARFVAEAAEGIRVAHDRVRRLHAIAETVHVHDVPHVAITTTEPLARLKEAARKGATSLVLQPRHAGHAFTKLVVGTEEVEVDGIAASRYTEPPAEMPAWVAGAGLWKPEVNGTVVTLTKPLKHSHDAGVAVSAEGFDPESVNADGMRCHDCRGELVADPYYERILVCQKVHGHRPTELRPKHADGAVECGQKPE